MFFLHTLARVPAMFCAFSWGHSLPDCHSPTWHQTSPLYPDSFELSESSSTFQSLTFLGWHLRLHLFYYSAFVSVPIHTVPTLLGYSFLWKHQKFPLPFFLSYLLSSVVPDFILLSGCFCFFPNSTWWFPAISQFSQSLPGYHFYFHGLDPMSQQA